MMFTTALEVVLRLAHLSTWLKKEASPNTLEWGYTSLRFDRGISMGHANCKIDLEFITTSVILNIKKEIMGEKLKSESFSSLFRKHEMKSN